MYTAKQHLLFDTVRHPDRPGDNTHGHDRLFFDGMYQQIGVHVLAAVDTVVMAKLVTGPGNKIVPAQLGIDFVFCGQFRVALMCKCKNIPLGSEMAPSFVTRTIPASIRYRSSTGDIISRSSSNRFPKPAFSRSDGGRPGSSLTSHQHRIAGADFGKGEQRYRPVSGA